MQQIDVFDGNKLNDVPVNVNVQDTACLLKGVAPNGEDVNISLDYELLSRHLLFLGGIGTGKTNVFFQIISQLRQRLTNDDIIIVFDTKGDFYKEFYHEGDVVISNDATAMGFFGTDYWNIFNEIENNEGFEETVIEISKTLFHEKLVKTTQPFFPMAAMGLFGAVLTHFIRKGDKKDNELLRRFLLSSEPQKIRALLQEHEDQKGMISYILDDHSPQTQGVISELQQMSREIFIGNFAKPGSLSIRNLVRLKGGRIVFIEYDLGIGKMLAPIYSLLFDMAIKEALSRNKNKGNIYIIMDEFSLIPDLQHIDDAVNFGRSLGVKFMVGIQNVNQIFNNYGEARARSLLSGFLTTVSFRVNDISSRQFIRDLHGENRKKETYMSSVGSRGITEQLRDGHVVEDWDVSRLKTGQAIIGLPGKEPFLFQFKRMPNKTME